MALSTPILTSVKNYLGIHKEDDSFDEILVDNTKMSLLEMTDIGVIDDADGEPDFSEVTNKTTWEEVMRKLYPRLDSKVKKLLPYVETFICISVRLLFDPPASQMILQMLKDKKNELIYRLNRHLDETTWTGGDKNGRD